MKSLLLSKKTIRSYFSLFFFFFTFYWLKNELINRENNNCPIIPSWTESLVGALNVTFINSSITWHNMTWEKSLSERFNLETLHHNLNTICIIFTSTFFKSEISVLWVSLRSFQWCQQVVFYVEVHVRNFIYFSSQARKTKQTDPTFKIETQTSAAKTVSAS